VKPGGVPRRLARSLRLYVVAVAVNVGVAAAAPTGADVAARPAAVRYLEGRRDRFDPRELAGSGTVLTVPLGTPGPATSQDRPSRN